MNLSGRGCLCRLCRRHQPARPPRRLLELPGKTGVGRSRTGAGGRGAELDARPHRAAVRERRGRVDDALARLVLRVQENMGIRRGLGHFVRGPARGRGCRPSGRNGPHEQRDRRMPEGDFLQSAHRRAGSIRTGLRLRDRGRPARHRDLRQGSKGRLATIPPPRTEEGRVARPAPAAHIRFTLCDSAPRARTFLPHEADGPAERQSVRRLRPSLREGALEPRASDEAVPPGETPTVAGGQKSSALLQGDVAQTPSRRAEAPRAAGLRPGGARSRDRVAVDVDGFHSFLKEADEVLDLGALGDGRGVGPGGVREEHLADAR